MRQMIIANRLVDGAVVFLAPDDAWEPSIERGEIVDDAALADRRLAVAKDHETASIVIDPQLIEIEIDGGKARPTAIREAIRAFGPTVRTDLPELTDARSSPPANDR